MNHPYTAGGLKATEPSTGTYRTKPPTRNLLWVLLLGLRTEAQQLVSPHSYYSAWLIRLETLIEQNQERMNRYEEDQREAGKSGLLPLCVAVGLRLWRLFC